ncbi:RES domain-containing protein [Vibrio parahaemolyticus]|uniref:RES domain-containing protein n=1 Tax=Vibrio parahaemolyticus TaxID=670 RepID=UPI0032976103
MFDKTRAEVSGTYVRICPEDQVDIALLRNSRDRPEGRYNRLGQDALYLTPTEESARIALQKYVSNITSRMVLVEYEIQPCMLVDLRSAQLEKYRTMVAVNWQYELSKGKEPSSWHVADLLRSHNEIGLVDPSRKEPSSWHVVLFKWNERGAPTVRICSDPKPIVLT